jgi:hypothetical protein
MVKEPLLKKSSLTFLRPFHQGESIDFTVTSEVETVFSFEGIYYVGDLDVQYQKKCNVT